MLTILSKSDQGEIKGGFRNFGWMSSNNLPDSATKTSWQVKTKYHKFLFIELLKMKHFFMGLNEDELRCLIDAPGVLTDEIFVSAIIAKRIITDEKILLQRLNILRIMFNKIEWSKNLYFSLAHRFGYEILEVRQATRRATKYSGYVRNASAVGSKRSSIISTPEPEFVEWTKAEKFDYLTFLTVGEFSSGTPGGNIFTLTRTKSSKRSDKLTK